MSIQQPNDDDAKSALVALTADEARRYKRHLLLTSVGAQGQQKLKAARVLVVGAGGLGSPVLLYLAAAGVGTIGVIDNDVVGIDNLQRQVAHGTADDGRLKVESAAEAMRRINPHVAIERHPYRIDATNAATLVSTYDIVADGSDNFATRYLVADACEQTKRTLVYGALGSFDGYVTVFKPHRTRPDGTAYPGLRTLFPEPPDDGEVMNCQDAGVLGPVAGVIGTLQATEVIKEILGLGESLAGRLLIYDAQSTRFDQIAL